MNRYIGVKQINAMPMTREEYNEFRGWQVPKDENPDDAGYLVEYVDGGKANTEQFKGYVSWSPKDVFERAYREVGAGMTFGMALDLMKAGSRVARMGWNGKGMWLALGQGCKDLPADAFWNPHTKEFAESNGGKADVLPYIIMKTAAGEVLMGWLASQSDMLAEDWVVIP